MSLVLFFQLCALIAFTTVLFTAATYVLLILTLKMMPNYTKLLMEGFESDLDDHFAETPDPKFFHPES